MQYQANKGIPSTGFVGPLTRASLNALCLSDTLDSSKIKVLSPKSGDVYNSGDQLKLQWTGYEGDFDYYQLILGNTKANIEVQIDDSYKISKTQNSYNTFALWSFVNQITKNSSYSADVINDSYYVKVNAIKTDNAGGRVVIGSRSAVFSIKSSTNPTPTPTINISSVTVSAYLSNASENRVGAWNSFAPNSGNINKNASDWKWIMKMSVPNGVNKNIKRITIIHNDSGEVWSTGYSRYLQNGLDLYGYNEHPYPLVVTQSGIQSNKEYDQTLNEKPYTPGNHEFVLYGQPESTSFAGGKLIVDFTDGTSSTSVIAASLIKQGAAGISPSPTPTSGATTIKVLSPNGGESFVGGSSYNIKWYDDNDAGNKNIYLVNSLGQITTLASNVFVRSSGIDGTYSYSWKVTDSIGSDQYKIKICKSNSSVCDLSDNTFQVSTCPAGYKCSYSAASPSPTPTNTPAQPSVSFIYPRYAETWYLGETKNVSWTYNNFDSSVSGEKYVELQLVPLDGRAPIVLGTYMSPNGYQPLTIYTKTTTGRDAWLPGQYKLKLACRSSNVEGYRNCRDDGAGYITVKAPTPTPTSSPVSVNSTNNQTGIELNASIWSAIEEYNRGR
jgi:hypothetical protein